VPDRAEAEHAVKNIASLLPPLGARVPDFHHRHDHRQLMDMVPNLQMSAANASILAIGNMSRPWVERLPAS
jgi:hypothetical protein